MSKKGTTRELKQVSENEFLLVVNDLDNRHKSEKGYNRQELRDIYDGLKVQYDQMKLALRDNNRLLAQNKVEITPEEKKLLDLMEKAAKHNEYLKIEKQVAEQKKDVETFERQMKEILTKIPEVSRKK